jgi:hypothetical protein
MRPYFELKHGEESLPSASIVTQLINLQTIFKHIGPLPQVSSETGSDHQTCIMIDMDNLHHLPLWSWINYSPEDKLPEVHSVSLYSTTFSPKARLTVLTL